MIRNIIEIIEKNSDVKVSIEDVANMERLYKDDENLYTNLFIIDESKDLSSEQKKVEMDIALRMSTLPKEVRDLYSLNPSNILEIGSKPLYTMIRILNVLKSKQPFRLALYLEKIIDQVIPPYYSNESIELKYILLDCSIEMTSKLIEKKCAGLVNVDILACIGMASLLYASSLAFFPEYKSYTREIKNKLPSNCRSTIDTILYDII